MDSQELVDKIKYIQAEIKELQVRHQRITDDSPGLRQYWQGKLDLCDELLKAAVV